MNIKVDINLKAPEIVKAIEKLAGSVNVGNIINAEKTDIINEKLESIDKKNISGVDKQVEISVEVIRSKLSALSQNGKQKQVKALISKYGCKKLSEIPKEKYEELLKDAEKL